jgi:hypothetical protein
MIIPSPHKVAIFALLTFVAIIYSKSCHAKEPVKAPIYSTGQVTVHSQPEGAAIFVLTDDGHLWQFAGYAPATLSVRLANGKTDTFAFLRAVPVAVAPGQFTQQGSILPGFYLPSWVQFFMYQPSNY